MISLFGNLCHFRPQIRRPLIRAILAFSLTFVALFASAPPTVRSNELSPTVKYDFKDGFMGWQAQTDKTSQACTEVLLSKMTETEGSMSLAMYMDLRGGDSAKGKGEAFVDLRDNPLKDEKIPLDMTDRTITVSLYAPTVAVRGGTSNSPNGFQVFVKDANDKSLYGSWDSKFIIGQWYQLTLKVSTTKPNDGYIDAGFDPSKIVVIGIKMGTAGDANSNIGYKGLVYIDNVSW